MLGAHPLPLNVPEDKVARLMPTLPNLVRHIDHYGLSNKFAGHRGRTKVYKGYKAFAKDPAIEVGLAYLSEEAYAQLVERYGERGWVSDARADWNGQREGSA